MIRWLGAGALYFAAIFAAGFALGVLRTLWVAPAIGETWAEIGETPLMLAISILAADAVAGRMGVPRRLGPRLGMGLSALALLLLAEAGVALGLRGGGLGAYLAGRDPRALAVYAAALAVVALAPALAALGRGRP